MLEMFRPKIAISVETGGISATMAEYYESTLCAEIRLDQVNVEKVRGVKIEEERRT